MMFLIEGIPDILLFRGFLEVSFKEKLKWIALYPLALIAMFAWWVYTKYVRLYLFVSDRRSNQ